MADTLPDFIVPPDDWVSVEDKTTLATGTALIIQNKGDEGILLAINSVKPAADDVNGPQVYGSPNPLSTITVDAGENTVWLKSLSSRSTLVNVQVGTASSGGGGGTPVTVQSNWDETDAGEGSFIQNKPTALSEFTNDLTFVEGVTAGTGPVTVDNTDPQNPIISSTAISSISVADEGSDVSTDTVRVDFAGDLVTATDAGGATALVTIDSASLAGTFADPITVQDQGVAVTTDLAQLNCVGGGITATGSAGNVTLTVPSIPTLASQLTNDNTFVESVTVGATNLTVDNSDPANPVLNTSAIEGIRVEKDGTQVIATSTATNYTGNGVTVTDAGSGEATVNIDTSNFINTFSAPITVQEEGSTVATAVDTINVVGGGTVTANGTDVTLTIPTVPTALSDLTNDVAVTSVIGVAPGISVDNTDPRQPRISTTAISGVRVEDEGIERTASATTFNYTGDLVTASDAGSGEVTINIDSSSIPAAPVNAVAISGEGTQLTADVSSINFVGGGVATAAGDNVTVTIPNIPTDVSELTNTSLLQSVVAGDNISVDNTDSLNPVISVDGAFVETVVAGTGISVDSSDTANPVVSENTDVTTLTQSSTQTIDLTTNRAFEVVVSSATTLSFNNVPPGSITFKLGLTVSGGAAVTFPTTRWPGGNAPTIDDGRNIFVFTTSDGGTSWDAIHVGEGVFS